MRDRGPELSVPGVRAVRAVRMQGRNVGMHPGGMCRRDASAAGAMPFAGSQRRLPEGRRAVLVRGRSAPVVPHAGNVFSGTVARGCAQVRRHVNELPAGSQLSSRRALWGERDGVLRLRGRERVRVRVERRASAAGRRLFGDVGVLECTWARLSRHGAERRTALQSAGKPGMRVRPHVQFDVHQVRRRLLGIGSTGRVLKMASRRRRD
jgi:hypothetical protein